MYGSRIFQPFHNYRRNNKIDHGENFITATFFSENPETLIPMNYDLLSYKFIFFWEELFFI